jgi:hypothetical protein
VFLLAIRTDGNVGAFHQGKCEDIEQCKPKVMSILGDTGNCKGIPSTIIREEIHIYVLDDSVCTYFTIDFWAKNSNNISR